MGPGRRASGRWCGDRRSRGLLGRSGSVSGAVGAGGRWRGSARGAAATRDVARPVDDLVDEAVLEGLVGGEPLVAVRGGGDLLDALAGLLGGQLRERALHGQDQIGLDLDLARDRKSTRLNSS